MENSKIWKVTAISAVTVIAVGIAILMASRGCRLSKPKKQKKHIRKRDVSSLDVSEEWEKVGSLKNIWVYPIKSCAGVPVPEAFIEKHGARVGECRDRIWDDLVVGFDCGDEAANWLSLALGCQCRLLYHGSSALSRRSTEKCIEKFPLFNTDDN
ncbi:hypothetical protein Avbf_12082, partial [Armadillidium vulgare]